MSSAIVIVLRNFQKYTVLSFCILISIGSSSQAVTFTLSGTINSKDTGRMLLLPVNNTFYYPYKLASKEAKVAHGSFYFAGTIDYPCAFYLGFKVNSNWVYLSDLFFIDPGTQTIKCNIDSLRESPDIKNRSMNELQSAYVPSFLSVNTELQLLGRLKDSLSVIYDKKIPDSIVQEIAIRRNNIYRRKDSVFLAYSGNHRSSYIPFWESIQDLSFGYSGILDSAFNRFSTALKNTYSGKALNRQLSTARVSCMGCKFPNVRLREKDNITEKAPIFSHLAGSFTLVDFWFSHCSPCIEQFPKLRELYSAYEKKGFSIIGISIDTKDQIQNWRQVISEKKIGWPQYLDDQMSFARSLAIDKWPSNFLLDEKGVIIQKNITTEQLAAFLSANMKTDR